MTKPGKRFALLCRISTHQQREGESLNVQEKRGREYVKRHAGRVTKIYKGIESATKPSEERALLRSLLHDAEAHKFDALWVLDKSRLSRSPEATQVVVHSFGKHGIELHTKQGRVDVGSAEGRFMSYIEAAADLLTSDRGRERTRQSREEMLEKNEHSHGKVPWGRWWNKETKKWGVYPEAKRLAQRMYRLCVVKKLSTKEIGQELGMPANTVNKRLHSAGVSRWLRVLQTDNGTKEFVLDIPALLTSAQAAAIERRLKANMTIMPEHKHRSLLQGLVRCWRCHGTMSHITSGDHKHGAYRHLPASWHQGCIRQVPDFLLERDVVASCGQLIASATKLRAAIEAALRDATGDLKDAKTELSEVQAEINRLEGAHKRCLDGLVYFDHSEGERKKLADKAKEISTHLENLRGTYEALRVKLGKSPEQSPAKIAAQMRRLFGFRGLAVLSLAKEKQRELVALVVGRASKESPEGIYVQNAAIVHGRPAAWEWQLRGSLGLLTGTASHLDALQEAGRAKLRLTGDTSKAERFAQLSR